MTVLKGQQAEPEIDVNVGAPQIVVEQPQTVEVDGSANAAPFVNAFPVHPQPAFKEPETVDVIAPTSMAEGFQFNVDAGGRMLRVQVPPGGVVAGQRFRATVLGSLAGSNNVGQDPHMIPHGRWRDDLCDCCRFGCCHTQCCLTFWCGLCALGQVMTRMKLNWCGEPISGSMPSFSTFKILFVIMTVYVCFNWITGAIVEANDEDNNDDFSDSEYEEDWVEILAAIRGFVGLAFLIFVVFLTIRTRGFIRRKYGIPAKCCGDCEDCCCSFWCNACTICQMARHTANFDHYRAACCSDNGLDAGAPEVV